MWEGYQKRSIIQATENINSFPDTLGKKNIICIRGTKIIFCRLDTSENIILLRSCDVNEYLNFVTMYLLNHLLHPRLHSLRHFGSLLFLSSSVNLTKCINIKYHININEIAH